jgi:15-cis-phytoene synthase
MDAKHDPEKWKPVFGKDHAPIRYLGFGMQDVFAYCADLVRTADHDRFIATLFAPAERRAALHALYAFNVELGRVREAAHAALPGEIRLQWWSDVVDRQRDDEARANPVSSALLATIERHGLSRERLLALIDARRFDLYDDAMAGVADLEEYARRTSSSLIALAAKAVADVDIESFAEPAGLAAGITGILRALPIHLARGQLFLPTEVLERHHVHLYDLFAGRSSAGLKAALAELRNLARHHLAAAGESVRMLPDQAIPAVVPVALVRASLDRLERSDPFSPGELSPWRRQWLIWRAAHNRARIAG